MKFYTQTHKHYCGIDLYARSPYVCILDEASNTLIHKNIKAKPERLMKLVVPCREERVIGVESMFSWYGSLTFAGKNGFLSFYGHALYMRAIHGGKAKNERSIHTKSPCPCAAVKAHSRYQLWRAQAPLDGGIG